MAAQAGGHPHVAEFVPGMRLVPPVQPTSKVSPMMNEPDGLWNMGESPDGRDVGGALGPDPLLAQQPTFAPLLDGGWTEIDGVDPDIVHYIGSFTPQPDPPVPGDESRASFEVVVPKVIEPGKAIVVAFFTQATFGGENPETPHAYPGDPAYYDLYLTGGRGPHIDHVRRNLDRSPVPPYRVAGVQFVPRSPRRSSSRP
ncbi:MAG: hypothetical protein R3F56_08025 [Planctomycetota bacterium]